MESVRGLAEGSVVTAAGDVIGYMGHTGYSAKENVNNIDVVHLHWVQQFGKRQKAMDFSGREIAKAAYNDRNSAYGWNVDHILPQSRGGKTADYNLICCHILTNDEKADI